jgi:hypothetical protein
MKDFHFSTYYFAFELSMQISCVPGIRSENKKVAQYFQTPPFANEWTLYKMPLFVWHDFSRGRDNKLHLKFDKKECVLLIYRMMPRMLNFSG